MVDDRLKKIYREIERQGLDAFLVSDLTNIKYLTGFRGTYGALLILNGKSVFFTDSRYYERAKKEVGAVSVRLISDKWPVNLLRFKFERLGFEELSVTFGVYKEWKKKLRGVRLAPVKQMVESVRQIKSSLEIRKIRRSIDLAEDVLKEMDIKVGISESELAGNLDRMIRDIQGSVPAFPVIAAFGKNSSIPHSIPGATKLSKGSMVMLDFGVKHEDYSSDLTRTLWMGRITEKFRKIYETVLNAQAEAINKIRPGVTFSEIDALARDFIKKKGYGKFFGHALGHGIGLAVHELPRVNGRNKSRLEEGMVFSVEPGIYIPGWGGVRIEDLVLVTKTGCEVLTRVPKQLKDILL